jgi:protoporphyrinogen oxidase
VENHCPTQDPYKSPIDAAHVVRGASEATPPIGYNTSYLYPRDGLNALAEGLAQGCDVRYGKKVSRVDVPSKTAFFHDGRSIRYESLLSTLPLNKMIEMTGLKLPEEADPYTSVLVLNIGGVRGAQCPPDHWLYLPGSRAGFHWVRFYSFPPRRPVRGGGKPPAKVGWAGSWSGNRLLLCPNGEKAHNRGERRALTPFL